MRLSSAVPAQCAGENVCVRDCAAVLAFYVRAPERSPCAVDTGTERLRGDSRCGVACRDAKGLLLKTLCSTYSSNLSGDRSPDNVIIISKPSI